MRRRNLLLLILVVALAGFLFFWELPREEQRQADESAASRLTRIDPAAVDSLVLQRATDRVTLALRGEEWWIVEPVIERARDSAVAQQIAALCAATSLREVAAGVDTTALDAFGLGGLRRANRWVRMKAGGANEVFWIGAANPTGEAVYLRMGGQRRVLLVDQAVAEIAALDHNSFRIYDLFDIKGEEIEALSVSSSFGSFSARKNDRGLWFTEEAQPRQLKRRMIHTITYDLASTGIRSYLGDGLSQDQWSAYGLHEPLLDVSFETQELAGRIRLGNEIEALQFYSRRDQNEALIQIPGQLLRSCEFTLEDFLEKNPIRDNFTLLDSLSVRWHSGASVTAIHGEEEWSLRPPPGWDGPADRFDISVRNVTLGLEELESDATMILASGSDLDETVPVRKVSCVLYWPDRTVRASVGWRSGEDFHWFIIEGAGEIHRIRRDLFFRLRGLLLVAEVIDPNS